MANPSIYAAFERMWQHVIAAIGSKANLDHNHDDEYYTELEIDGMFAEIGDKADAEHTHDIDDIKTTSGTLSDDLVSIDDAIKGKTQVQIVTWGVDD